MGRHAEPDEDDPAQRDGFVGWIPTEPEPGQHAADEPEDSEEDE